MKLRTLIRALAVTLLLLPLISAWCPSCLAGSCSMVTQEGREWDKMAAAEAASSEGTEVSCHTMDADPAVPPEGDKLRPAVAAADAGCCTTAVGSAPLAIGAPVATANVGFDLESAHGAAAPASPRLGFERGEDHPPPPRILSIPLYTLHSSLLL